MSAPPEPRTSATTELSAGGRAASVGQGDTLAGAFASALRGADEAAARFAAMVRGGLFDSAPPPGIARYRLERVLGRGGMGEVWVARDEQLGREVAVKLVHPSRSDDAMHLTQLAREARALARLAHPNVVAVFDLGHYPAPQGRRGLFIVMELVDGVPLSAWLGRRRDTAEIVRVFAQAGRGLAAAHGAGLVHRDVKPANIFVGHDGRVRVGDFGLARRAAAPAEVGATTLGDHLAPDVTRGDETGSGVVMGTPLYMAPEQHLGAAVDASADQYALCVALFEALWGVRPFAGNVHALLEAKLRGPPQLAPARGRPSPSPALEAVVRRGLSPSPTQRWPSMDALVDALVATQRRRARGLLWLGGLAIAAVGFGVVGRERCGAPLSAAVHDAGASLPQALATVRNAVAGPSQSQWALRLQTWPQQFERALASVCESDPQAQTARWDCLARARHGFAAVVQGLADEPTLTAGAVTTMTTQLQDPSLCVELARPTTVPPELRPQVDAALARMQHAVARRAFRPDEALSELREATVALERVPPSEALAWTQHELGLTYDNVSAWADAARLYEACYLTAVQVDDDDQAVRCALMSASKAAEMADDEGMRRWLAHADALLGRAPLDPERKALRASAIATAAFVRGAYGEAAVGMREAVEQCRVAGCDQLAVSTAIGLASAESLRGDAVAAMAAWRQAQAIVEARTGPDSRDARMVRFRLSQARVGLGEIDAALAEFEAAIAASEGDSVPDAVLLARLWAAHGDALQRLGRDGAATSSMRALAWARVAYADAPQLLVPYLLEAGQLLALADAPAAALALYTEAAPLVAEQPRAAVLLDVARAAALLRLGEPARASSLAHDARVWLEADPEASPSNLAAARHNEADAAIALGRCDDAVPLLQAAIARYDDDAGIGAAATSTTDARLSLAGCLRALGRVDGARAALQAIRDQPTANADHRARAEAELAALP